MVKYHCRRHVTRKYCIGDGVTVRVRRKGRVGAAQKRLFGVIVKIGKSGQTYLVRTEHGVLKEYVDGGELEIHRGAKCKNIKTQGWEDAPRVSLAGLREGSVF